MLPHTPRCENRRPYCRDGGRDMKCVKETPQEWVFMCAGCGQTNIITRPEFKRSMREQAERTRRPPEPFHNKYF